MSKLPVTEELDFHYLLSLMRPLYNIPEYAWLPELFSIIGHERLITLCKYAGGETIKIPPLEQLNTSIEALDYFYKVYISKKLKTDQIPEDLKSMVNKILEVYNATNC